MIRKNIAIRIHSRYDASLVMCSHIYDEYDIMKFYVVTPLPQNNQFCGFGNGMLIMNQKGTWDFIPSNDFKEHFTFVDGDKNRNKLYKHISWLIETRKFNINIKPTILENGYWYEYTIKVGFPFNVPDVRLGGFESYIKAAKYVINVARKACLEHHAKDGLSKWIDYCCLFKKR